VPGLLPVVHPDFVGGEPPGAAYRNVLERFEALRYDVMVDLETSGNQRRAPRIMEGVAPQAGDRSRHGSRAVDILCSWPPIPRESRGRPADGADAPERWRTPSCC